eukprot:14736463-Ditylum_brightwellii.AAC.1
MHYIEGPKNILVEHFLRLKRLVTPAQLAKGRNLVQPACVTGKEDGNNENPEQNFLSFHHIREQQQSNAKLLAVQQKVSQNYIYKCLDDNVTDIACYFKDFHDPITQ